MADSYYERNKERCKQYQRQYYARNKDHYRQRYLDNRAEHIAYQMSRYRVKGASSQPGGWEWMKRLNARDPVKAYALRAKWSAQRRLRLRQAGEAKVSWAELKLLLSQCDQCAYCSRKLESLKDKSIDHVISLKRGGQHTKENLIVCCRSCNSRKSSKPLDVWLKELCLARQRNNEDTWEWIMPAPRKVNEHVQGCQ